MAKFGEVAHITDKEYYTNSFHYDVRKNPTPFEKLEFEKDYPVYTSGGFIHYCEYPKLQTNPKALEAVWDFAYSRVGYLGTNTPIIIVMNVIMMEISIQQSVDSSVQTAGTLIRRHVMW